MILEGMTAEELMQVYSERIYLLTRKYKIDTEEGKTLFMAAVMFELGLFGFAYITKLTQAMMKAGVDNKEKDKGYKEKYP